MSKTTLVLLAGTSKQRYGIQLWRIGKKMWKISATNSLRQTADPFLRLAHTRNDRLAEQVHVCTIRPFYYASCSYVSGRVCVLETHVTLQASFVILVNTAIRRESRFCRLRILSIHGFPFVGPILSAARNLCAHTPINTSMVSHSRGPHLLKEGLYTFEINVLVSILPLPHITLRQLLHYISSSLGVMYRWWLVSYARGFPPPPRLTTRPWPWSCQPRFRSSWCFSWKRPTRLAKDWGTVFARDQWSSL
jgi:hypothetical protein